MTDHQKMISNARADADGWEAYAQPLTGRAYFNAVGVARTLRELSEALEGMASLAPIAEKIGTHVASEYEDDRALDDLIRELHLANTEATK